VITAPNSTSSVIRRLLDSLPDDAPVTDIRIGTHWTVVVVETLNSRRAGLAATQMVIGPEHGRPLIRDAGNLLGKMGIELAALALADSPTERSLGFAAMNALLEVQVLSSEDQNAEQIILRMGKEKRVAIVGHFPFIARVRQEAKECWVLELNPGPEDVPASRAPELIPQADVVAITGMTLVNHTFDGVVSLCRRDAYVLVLGPSTPLSPVLFDYGVDALSGTVVEDIPAVLRGVSQGATFRQLTGRRLVTLESAHWSMLQTHEDNHGAERRSS
jgi:uncharacterized protein